MPKIKHNALSDAKIRALTPGAYADGNGLTLKVDASGNRRWFQRVTVGGKRHNLGLGGYPAVGLKAARKTAMANVEAISEGRDPVIERQRAQIEAQRPAMPTFRQAAEQVINLRRPTWSSARHAQQWTESLTNHAYPLIGNLPVNEITTADCLAVLTPIWVELAETSTRVKQRMGVIFDYAIASGWRSDNPAAAVASALPRRARVKRHHPALPYGEVPAALKAIRQCTAERSTRQAFEFMALTAARAGEVRGATWAEIDIDGRVWEVPAERMKARRGHRVPLSDRALAILSDTRKLSDGDGLIFPNRISGKPLSNMAFTALLRRLKIEAVPHGFRSSFKDWTISETATPWAVGESALAHNLGNSVEAAYARTDLFDKRRELMQQWADFAAEPAQSGRSAGRR